MTKIVDEELERRLQRGTYRLEPDFLEGFRTCVKNGQVMLALEYLAEHMTDLEDTLAELKKSTVEKVVPETVKSKTAKKTTTVSEEQGSEEAV